MNYQETISYLKSFINYEQSSFYSYPRAFRLRRVEALFKYLNVPFENLNYIHIAGSKGKGSVCSMVSSILVRAGFKVGLFTSPHLQTIRERIRVFTKEDIYKDLPGLEGLIPEEDLIMITHQLKPGLEKFKKERKEFGKVTFFEVYTLLAIAYFLKRKVDFAVLEVGMGGRLDATNIVNPLVSGITSISLEHTNILGKSLDEIALQKSGIIKQYGVVVNSVQHPEAQSVIEKQSKLKKAKLYQVGKDILFETVSSWHDGEIFNLKTRYAEYSHLKLSLPGRHQVINAAAAVGIVEALTHYQVYIDSSFIKQGLSKTYWPGRLELVSTKPYILLDGAQNRESANVLKKALQNRYNYKRLYLILGICRDKDIKGFLSELLPLTYEIFYTKIKNPRSASYEQVIESMGLNFKNITYFENAEEAFKKAIGKATAEDLILVTGSLFLIGEIKNQINKPVPEKI